MSTYPLHFHKSSDSLGPAELAIELREWRLQRLLGLLRLLGPYAEDLLELLRGVSLGELPGLLDAIRRFKAIEGEWTDAAALKPRVLAALGIFAAWAKVTPGDSDDALAVTLGNWARTHEAVLDFVVGLVGAALEKWLKVQALAEGLDEGRPLNASEVFGEMAVQVQALEAKEGKLKALAVDWDFVLTLARQLFELIVVLLQARDNAPS